MFKINFKKNKNKILMPSDKTTIKEYSLEHVIKKILKVYGYKIKYMNKISNVKNSSFPVVISNKNLEGQKIMRNFTITKMIKLFMIKIKKQ